MADQINPQQPMAEVFGFPIGDQSTEAQRYRSKRLCPFNNKVPNCTKDKAKDPLGVCSVYEEREISITCPVRFRQDWIIADDAAEFFFPPNAKWTTLTEVRLADRDGKSAGNIDVVLVAYDECGKVYDFGALEVQAVYISGNIRNPFEHYMKNPSRNANMDWRGEENYPRPDYLSSSRKRLAPQSISKIGILKTWKKKTAVALNRSFFTALLKLDQVNPADAEIAWMVYDLKPVPTSKEHSQFQELAKVDVIYTRYPPAFLPEPFEIPEVSVFLSSLDHSLETIAA